MSAFDGTAGSTLSGLSENSKTFQLWPVSNRGLSDSEPPAAVTLWSPPGGQQQLLFNKPRDQLRCGPVSPSAGINQHWLDFAADLLVKDGGATT